MWVQGSEPIGKGQPTWPVHMLQIPPSWASYLPFPALSCCWKRVGDHQTRLGFLQPLSLDTEMKPGWACFSWRQLWAGLWLLYRDQHPHEKWLSSAAASIQPDAPWSLPTRLSAAVHTEITSLTMPFLLFLQAAHLAQTGVLTNSVWTGNITSASQWSFNFP